ncbi:MAG: DUF1559 domain-containing protein [Pirellulaceae bacterium]|nr:DUF1559 domain-containing protein [Pirellulaceae bacterium]
MPFVFRCPHCGTETEVDDQYAGHSGPCAVCGRIVTVPYAASNSASTLAVRRAAAVSVPVILGVTVVGLIAAATVIGMAIVLLAPVIKTARTSGHTIRCSNNLKQIAMALQAYEADHGSLPPAYLADANGKPMHSWRVLILPYLGHDSTYKQYDFSQPWDSPQNVGLKYLMPEAYLCPSDGTLANSDETSYLVVVGRRTAFPPDGTTRLNQITDGLSHTVLVVETSGEAVCWMEPKDLDARRLQFQINGGQGEPGSKHPAGCHVVTADGVVHFLHEDAPPDGVRALTTIAGGEPIPWNRMEGP